MVRLAACVALLSSVAAAQQPAYAQCGGKGWSGATTCAQDYTCSVLNEWFHQCVPGAATATPKPTTTAPTTTVRPGPTTVTVTSVPSTLTTSKATTTGGAGTAPPKTLLPGFYWVRAVVAPNFHSYLQAAPTATPSPGPGDAYILSASNAGQYNVVDGQLVYNTGSSTLYMHVENVADKTQRTLATSFESTKSTYGTFAFQGDTLTWTVADIKRPNPAAWLVCGGKGKLYVNTGSYAYDTPAGCVDQTIHYYNGATPDV